MKRTAVLVLVTLLALLGGLTGPPAASAADPTLPSHTAIVSAAKRTLDYYRPTYAVTTTTQKPKSGWSWSTYFEGVGDLYRHSGDSRYQSSGMAWGSSTS